MSNLEHLRLPLISSAVLAPAYLKEARADFAAGRISREKLTATEDKAISEACP